MLGIIGIQNEALGKIPQAQGKGQAADAANRLLNLLQAPSNSGGSKAEGKGARKAGMRH